jgi:guanylate kinase
MQALLIAISSPSGGGKTTIIQEVRKRRPQLGYSVSCTTRKPRPGEVDGRDYIFLSEHEFKTRAENGDFLEWEWVHGYFYGTLKQTIAQALNTGKSLLFDIDIHGAQSLKQAFPDNALLIFLQPPDLETLKRRLMARAQDAVEDIQTRLDRVKIEMDAAKNFDNIIINDDLTETVDQVMAAIDHRQRST